MTLSIIVTVYNKEQYLERCLDSCINQNDVDFDSYEILVVNDGSTDNSLSIIQGYVNKYPIIKVIDQPNQGLSMARNHGVDAASGNYIWFVDSDDYIADCSVKLLQEAMVTEPDIIPIYAETQGIDYTRNQIPVNASNGRDILLSMRWNHCGPFYIYNRSFLVDNNFRYMPGIYHEDSELTPRLLYSVKKAVVVPHILYTVYRDPQSITQTPKMKRAFDNLTVATLLYDFTCSKVVDDMQLQSVFDYNVAQLFNNGMGLACRFGKSEQREFADKAYLNRRIYKACKNSILKYRIEGYLLSIFPHRCLTIYKLLQWFNTR